MKDYLCVTLISHRAEPVSAIAARLSTFWTTLLRTDPDTFEMVYAETTSFDLEEASWTRRYLIEVAAAEPLEAALRAAGVAFHPIDRTDIYTRYEASSPDWMQIEH